MKRFAVAGLAVAVVALVLAAGALVSAPEGADDVRVDLKTVTSDVDQLNADLGALKGGFAEATSARAETPGELVELGAQVEKLSGQVARLEQKLAALAERPAGQPAAKVAVDEDKMRELVRNAMRAQFDQMRARGTAARGGAAGGANRGPTRVDVAKVPQAAKDAATKAVQGFKIDHAHPAAKTADGKDTFYIDGNAGGRSHRVRVTAEGKVLESAPRSRRGRGRPPARGQGTQQPARGGNEPEAF